MLSCLKKYDFCHKIKGWFVTQQSGNEISFQSLKEIVFGFFSSRTWKYYA